MVVVNGSSAGNTTECDCVCNIYSLAYDYLKSGHVTYAIPFFILLSLIFILFAILACAVAKSRRCPQRLTHMR